MNKKYDFIVFGASGFTGKLVVEYVWKTYGFNSAINWAIAGRNKQKLLSIKADLDIPNNLEIFIVDSNDKNSINAMTKNTNNQHNEIHKQKRKHTRKNTHKSTKIKKCKIDVKWVG